MASTVLRFPLQSPSTGLGVVLVSDSVITRLGLRLLLDESDRATCVAAAADAAEARLAVDRLRPDVAVIDLRLPVADWLSLISDLARATKVVVISSSPEPWFVASTLHAGATSYVLRGELGGDWLLQAIVATGAGERWLSPAVAATARDLPDVAGLSRREVEVLDQLARGRSNAQIASALYLSHGTVKNHVSRILAKLGVHNRAEAIVLWLRWSKGIPA